MRIVRTSRTHAVSPVVGIMLMIVVVIVIAAVVAGFAGGLVSPTKKTPSLILDVKIVNTGFWYSGSGFYATVTGISRPISTSELKIVTSWTIANRTTGERETGGSTVMPSVTNINRNICNGGASDTFPITKGVMTAPFGTGPGVILTSGQNNGVPGWYPNQQFGAYTLEQGTGLEGLAQHCSCRCIYSTNGVCSGGVCSYNSYGGGSQYVYPDTSVTDGAAAVLGQNWNDLRAGDTVNVKVIHLPTNAILFDKNILVTG